MTIEKPNFTVIGAGNGGRAMAAHLAILGFEVTLFNRTPGNIAGIKARKGIKLDCADSDGPHGFGQLACVTSNIEEAITNSDIIMVITPANAHSSIAVNAAPYLKPEQVVILNPGRTLGAIEFSRILEENGCVQGVTIAEAQTFIYASRSEGPAQARIFRVKDAVPLAALPASETPRVLDLIKPAYPQFIDGGDVLQTGLNNIGAIFHPAISLLNMGRIESTQGDFQFYLDGVTPTVAHLMEVLDRERVTVASAVGIQAVSAKDWLKIAYNSEGMNLYEAIHNQPGYQGIKAPTTFSHRYISEEIPMSLIPIASLGNRYGVSVRGIDSIIRLACIAHRTDFMRYGRTLERLGIAHLSVSELTRYVKETGKIRRPIQKRISQTPFPITTQEEFTQKNRLLYNQ